MIANRNFADLGRSKRLCHFGRSAVRLVLSIVLLAILTTSEAVSLSSRTSTHKVNDSSLGPTRWGLWRPNWISGIRSNIPDSPVFGLGWRIESEGVNAAIRYLSQHYQKGELQFEYLRHDGRNYAQQRVQEHALGVELMIDWVQHPSSKSWSLRVSGYDMEAKNRKPASPSRPKMMSIFFFAGLGLDESELHEEHDPNAEVNQNREDYGQFKLMNRDDDILQDGIRGPVHISADAPLWPSSTFELYAPEPAYGTIRRRFGNRKPRQFYPEFILDDLDSRVRMEIIRSRPALDEVTEDLSLCRYVGQSLSALASFSPIMLLQYTLAKLKSKSSAGLFLLPNEISGKWEQEHLAEKGIQQDEKTVINTFLLQRIVKIPFELDFVFVDSGAVSSSNEHNELLKQMTGQDLSKRIQDARDAFDQRFLKTFALPKLDHVADESLVSLSHYLLSNTLGGIGFFHGSSVTRKESIGDSRLLASITRKSEADETVRILPRVSLFTSTPSRVTFPRGFLWDEGFHQLLILRWDPALSLESISTWLDVMLPNGWIPREQVLGSESRSMFAPHIARLMFQNPTVANPPTFLLPWRVLAFLCSSNALLNPEVCRNSAVWTKAKLKLHTYIKWLDTSQRSHNQESYYWKGRTSDFRPEKGKNPFTFASGLDDYPRAFEPNREELHLDLHCWMTWAFEALADVFKSQHHDSKASVEFDKPHLKDANPAEYSKRVEALKQSLEKLFAYRDSLATDHDASHQIYRNLLLDFDGKANASVTHIGYVTLFPMLLGILDTKSPHLPRLLDLLEDESQLKSVAGVRSLSISDRYYDQGDSYWTGPSWMPMNYLVLASLHSKYAKAEGPYRNQAARVYKELRQRILGNVLKDFEKQGTVYEQYHDVSGMGQRGPLFTGWSALVLLIITEQYSGIVDY